MKNRLKDYSLAGAKSDRQITKKKTETVLDDVPMKLVRVNSYTQIVVPKSVKDKDAIARYHANIQHYEDMKKPVKTNKQTNNEAIT